MDASAAAGVHSAAMLAKQYADALIDRMPPAWFRPAPGRAWWLLIYSSIATACTVAIVKTHPGVLAGLGLAVIIGFSYCCMGILGHEILHGSVVESLWLRRCLGAVCLAPLGMVPAFWTFWHNIHHAYTQHPAKDPDTWGTVDSSPLDPIMGLLRRFTNARATLFPLLLATGMTAHAIVLLVCMQKQMTPRQRAATLTEFLLLCTLWLGLGFRLGWANFLFFLVIPMLVANAIINSFVVTNHFLNPLDDTGDPLAGSLTVTMHPWIEWLFLNFNYHVEHHLFPRMSPKYAPQVARLLKESWPDRYHSMPCARALLAVWRTPRVYQGRTQLIDTGNSVLFGTLGYGLEADARRPEPSRAP